MPVKKITINSRKYDRKIRRTWKCRVIEQTERQIEVIGEFDRDVEHPGLGSIRRGTVSFEFYWFDRWYNIFRFHEPDGDFRNFYCNVAMPATLADGVLDYVDLDIDIVVWPDNRYEVVDRDDFDNNAIKYSYTEEVFRRAEDSVDELIKLIEGRKFPFNDLSRLKLWR